MVCIFLGAGASAPAGVPLASQLFDREPIVDRVTRRKLVEKVRHAWVRWHRETGGGAEEYLEELSSTRHLLLFDTHWYVALAVALTMGRVELVGGQTTITRHNINRTSNCSSLEEFWTSIFKKTDNVSVVTTNYDVVAERCLRHEPRPRVPRPGFNYGEGEIDLAGGGYPSYSHIHKITSRGTVPLYKLHGSVSWAVRNGSLVRYHDCRPAIRGDAAIVAPIKSKKLPSYLESTWQGASRVLSTASAWIVVGYSLPEYDSLVRELFLGSAHRGLTVHVFDPNVEVASRFRSLLAGKAVTVIDHAGLPKGISDISSMCF